MTLRVMIQFKVFGVDSLVTENILQWAFNFTWDAPDANFSPSGRLSERTANYRERLNVKIAEEERRSRHLKEAQRNLKENEPTNERQAVLWESVEK
jgi:hypothetical protein